MYTSPRRSFAASLSLAAIGLVTLAVSGCATTYVDNGLKDVADSEYVHPQAPKPVQLIFSFETKGVANARATDYLKNDVTAIVNNSHLFSTVSADPVAGGSILSVTINNVPVTDNAFAKGFATGLTFGLAGNVVTDGYVCTIDYLGASSSSKITKSRSHAIHTTVGAKGAPPNATKAASQKDAVETMTRQVVGNTLKDLAADPTVKL
jgi:hypothetical protein